MSQSRMWTSCDSFKFHVSRSLCMEQLIERLKEFMENEARSGSMDFGCITPLYVYRAWGGRVAIEEIAKALPEAIRML